MKLPDLVYEQLRHLLSMGEANQWAVGDFIRDVWIEIEMRVPDGDERKEHAAMIRLMAENTGADESTLRSRKKMSTFYDKITREEWMPPYTYHHLRALMAVGRDQWTETATWGLTGGWNGGLVTVKEIREHIRGKTEPLVLTQQRLERLQKLASKIIEAEETPRPVGVQLSLIPIIVEDALDLL